jgi:hypothetical protein
MDKTETQEVHKCKLCQFNIVYFRNDLCDMCMTNPPVKAL